MWPTESMPHYSYSVSLVNQHKIPIKYGTNYILYEDEGQYGPYAIPPKVMPRPSHLEDLVEFFLYAYQVVIISIRMMKMMDRWQT